MSETARKIRRVALGTALGIGAPLVLMGCGNDKEKPKPSPRPSHVQAAKVIKEAYVPADAHNQASKNFAVAGKVKVLGHLRRFTTHVQFVCNPGDIISHSAVSEGDSETLIENIYITGGSPENDHQGRIDESCKDALKGYGGEKALRLASGILNEFAKYPGEYTDEHYTAVNINFTREGMLHNVDTGNTGPCTPDNLKMKIGSHCAPLHLVNASQSGGGEG